MLENYWQLDYAYRHSHRNHFDHVGLSSLATQLVFINEHSLRINQLEVEHDATVIRSAAGTGRLPVLCLDSNPYDIDQYLTELEKHMDSGEFFVFHPDIRAEKSWRMNCAPWPSWLCNQQLDHNYQLEKPKTRRISFLSGVARYHRLMLFRHIRSLVTDQDVVVANRFSDHLFEDTVPAERLEQVRIEQWLSELPWSNCAEYIDTEASSGNAINPGHNSHPAYSACVNITGETLGFGDQVLISEKTWKAYLSGCLVVNFGVESMTQTLSRLGLEIWNEYDQEESIYSKISRIQELFIRDDIVQLYADNRSMIQHNQQLSSSPEFARKLAEPAVQKISAMI